MAIYKVSIPFVPTFRKTLGSSSTCTLPKDFDLQEISVKANSEGIYIAELELDAPSAKAAKLNTIERVKELLYLFATRNGGFQLSFGPKIKAERIPDGKVTAVLEDIGTTKHISIKGHVEPEGHLSIVKLRNSVDFELRACQWREEWPNWLKIALELNYLAVTSNDTKTALITQYSALEVLTEAIEGKSSSILNLAFVDREEEKQLLVGEIENSLQRSGINKSQIDRLLSQIQNTQSNSIIDRIQAMLGKCNIEADTQDIKSVTKQRGSIIHSGTTSDPESLQKAENLARTWVQRALCYLIDTRLENLS